MGLIRTSFEFDFPAPEMSAVVQKISEVTGLRVLFQSDEVDLGEGMYDHSYFIAFDAFPDNEFQLYCYRPGAVQHSLDELVEGDFEPNWPMPVEGSDEREGKQSYYLSGYLGQELTLYTAAAVALQLLGGSSPAHDLGSEKTQFPVSLDQLRENHRQHSRQMKITWAKTMLLLPIAIPVFMFRAVAALIKMPFGIRRALIEVEKRYGNKNNRA